MRGLDSLRPLPDGKGWGPPTSLPSSVAALKRLREEWFGGAGGAIPGSGSEQAAVERRPALSVRLVKSRFLV